MTIDYTTVYAICIGSEHSSFCVRWCRVLIIILCDTRTVHVVEAGFAIAWVRLLQHNDNIMKWCVFAGRPVWFDARFMRKTKITNCALFFSIRRSFKNYDFSLDIKQNRLAPHHFKFSVHSDCTTSKWLSRITAAAGRFCQHFGPHQMDHFWCWFVRCYLENLCTHSQPTRICALNLIKKVNWTETK